jgi:hypothetical protein
MSEEIKKLTPEEFDKIVCEWSMAKGVALTEEQINNLVDRLSILVLGYAPTIGEITQ